MSTQRKDGREALQLRAIACEQSSLVRADGAAQFAQGNTMVIASVYGPCDVPGKKELADRAAIEVIFKPKSKMAGLVEKAKEVAIREALDNIILSHLHPRALISVVIQVLQDEGSLLSCAINASCLALMDAGVSLRACVAASTIAILPETGLHIDPLLEEEKTASAVMTFAFTNESTESNIVLTNACGKFSPQDFLAASAAAFETSRHIFAFYRKSIEKRLKKEKRV